MAIDYLSDVKPMEDAGKTDTEIASHLSSRTGGPIPCDEAKVVLEESGLVIEDPVSLARSGTLIDRYNAMPANQLKVLLGWFISHVFGRGQQISSHTQPRAVQLAAVLASLPADLQAVGTAILALGGGQPDAGTDAAGVDAVRQQYNADQVAAAERQARTDAYSAIRDKAQAAIDAAQAARTAEQTPAQITAAGDAAYNA